VIRTASACWADSTGTDLDATDVELRATQAASTLDEQDLMAVWYSTSLNSEAVYPVTFSGPKLECFQAHAISSLTFSPETNVAEIQLNAGTKSSTKVLNPNGGSTTQGTLHQSQTTVTIIVVVVCCTAALIVIALVLFKLVLYCRRTAQTKQDKQILSPYDSDSFIGHAPFNSSPCNSIKQSQRNSVAGKMQYVDSADA